VVDFLLFLQFQLALNCDALSFQMTLVLLNLDLEIVSDEFLKNIARNAT
jgi:hypothetical protein